MFFLDFTLYRTYQEVGDLSQANLPGKQLGRPKKILDTHRIATLRAKGVGWKRIAAELGVGVGTIYRVALDGSTTRAKFFLNAR